MHRNVGLVHDSIKMSTPNQLKYFVVYVRKPILKKAAPFWGHLYFREEEQKLGVLFFFPRLILVIACIVFYL